MNAADLIKYLEELSAENDALRALIAAKRKELETPLIPPLRRNL